MGHARSERRPAPVALLAIAIAAGCAAEEPDPGRFMDTGWIVVASRTDGPDAESHVLEMPHAVRWAMSGDRAWILDGPFVKTVDRDLRIVGVRGGEGSGPGEFRAPVGIAPGSDDLVWVSDIRLGTVTGWNVLGDSLALEPAHRLFVDGLAQRVAADRRGRLWVTGDLLTALLVVYGPDGARLYRAGAPSATERPAPRLNEGVFAAGTHCDVVWAYTFQSSLHCLVGDQVRWSAAGPIPVRPDPDADPHRMTPDARFAYIDIAVDDGRVYALFVGRSPVAEEGIATRSVHVFDEETGGYLGTLRLPEAVTSIDVLGREVIALRWEPVPSLFLLRMDGPPA